MARWENEDTSHLHLPERDEQTIQYFNNNGEQCSEKTAFSKIVKTVSENTEYVKHYIKVFRGELIDPHSIDYNLNTKLASYKKVSEATFNYYTRYLRTKNRLFYTRARQSYR